MVNREISIQHFFKCKNLTEDKPVTVLVVGLNDKKRKALCQTILNKIYPDEEFQNNDPSPFVFYEGPKFKLLSVRVVDDEIVKKKVRYVVLMDDATNLKKIWKYTQCDHAITKFSTFKTIFHNCAKDLEVMWIDAQSTTPIPSDKLFWSAYKYSGPVYNVVDDGEIHYELPEKISHIGEKDDDECFDPENPDGYCTML